MLFILKGTTKKPRYETTIYTIQPFWRYNYMTDTNNPLLQDMMMPGETFRLPSRGTFYTNGELSDDCVDGEVHVHPMTTHDEIIFKNVDKLYSGKATHDVFSRLIPQINQPLQLLAKDVDYLLIALRVISYGDEMEIVYNHHCQDDKEGEESKDQHYMVNIRQFMRQTREIDPTSLQNFNITLENGRVVTLQPPRFIDTVRMYQATSTNNELQDEDYVTLMLDNLAGMIVDVDGVSEKVFIRQWLDKVKAGDINKLSDKIVDISDWGTEHQAQIKCRECGEMMKVDIPINPITFFM